MELSQNKECLKSLHKLHLMIAYEAEGNFTKFNEIVSKSGLLDFNKKACF